MRSDIYEFNCENKSWFYEPLSGGVFQHHPLLRELFDLVPLHGEDDARKILLARYPSSMVDAYFRDLHENGVLPLEMTGKNGGESVPENPETLEEMYLQISHHCNLACSYCYAKGGDFGGSGGLMTESVAFKAVDFLLNASGGRNIVFINFDGGEPLLNFPLLKSVIPYAKEQAKKMAKTVRFNISTNGVLFNRDIVDFLAAHQVGIGVSIDGEEAVHDSSRKFKNQKGSYRLLLKKLRESGIFQYPDPVNARATVVRDALACSRTVTHLYELGFHHIYLEPASGKNISWAVNQNDLETMKLEFDIIAEFYRNELLKGSPLIIRNFFQPLTKIHRRGGTAHRCSAALRMISVSPGGKIYPCYKFTGYEPFIMGSIHNEIRDIKITGLFRSASADSREPCRKCWARRLCGGGCAYLGQMYCGNLTKPDPLDCEFSRHVIRRALEIYVGISVRDRMFWKRFFSRNRAFPE